MRSSESMKFKRTPNFGNDSCSSNFTRFYPCKAFLLLQRSRKSMKRISWDSGCKQILCHQTKPTSQPNLPRKNHNRNTNPSLTRRQNFLFRGGKKPILIFLFAVSEIGINNISFGSLAWWFRPWFASCARSSSSSSSSRLVVQGLPQLHHLLV